MDIYICGALGYETAKKLFFEHEEELRARFAKFYIQRFEAIESEAAQPPAGDFYVREILKGGIFAALWTAGEDLGCGLSVSVSDIPVRQEIVEIMELFNENPYECSSKGAFMIVDICGEGLPEGCALIGRTNSKKSRTVVSPAGIRYLTPPERQEKDIAVRIKAR